MPLSPLPHPSLAPHIQSPGLEVWLSWQRALLACPKPWVSSLAPHKPVAVGHDYNPSSSEVEAGGSEVYKHLRLHSKFKATLGTLRLCFRNKDKNKQHLNWTSGLVFSLALVLHRL